MYLLDTNHCSALIFGDSILIKKIAEVGTLKIAISVITEGELLYMAENSTRIEENLAIIKEFLQDISVYDIDSNTSAIYAKLKAKIMELFAPKEKSKRRKTKITDLGIGENDLWIASTAIANSLTIVSADRDFIRIKEAWNFALETWSV
jgi:tRNA(fMet)-specific endonuclease VapC